MNDDPWKIPKKSGNFFSKYRLCRKITIAEMKIAPIIPVSSVLIPPINLSPLSPPGSAAKFTPKNLQSIQA